MAECCDPGSRDGPEEKPCCEQKDAPPLEVPPAERLNIVEEFYLFLKENKAYWMAPILIVLLLLIAFVVLAPAYAPGIYTLF